MLLTDNDYQTLSTDKDTDTVDSKSLSLNALSL